MPAPRGRWGTLLSAIAALLMLPAGLARGQGDGPPTAPLLRIETGVHAGEITRAALVPGRNLVATGAYDGTIRLWSLPGLELRRTIRLPQASGRQGAVYALGAAPDGRRLAAGGWTGGWGGQEAWCVHLIAVATGAFEGSRCDLPARPTALAWSADGRHIAVAMKKGGGLIVLRAADLGTAARDSDYGDDSNWVEFDAGGRLVTTSLDGQVRLYGRDFRRLAARRMADDRAPTCATFAPDGTRIAVGYGEIDRPQPPAVDVLSADDLATLYRPDVRGIDNGVLSRLAWSADGRSLFAGGTYQRGGRTQVRRWTDAGRGRPRDFPSVPERTNFLLALDGGAVLAAGITPHLLLIGEDGRIAVERHPPIADFRGIGEALKVSADGRKVGFAFEAFGRRLAMFSLDERVIREGADVGAGLAGALTEHEAVDLRDWQGGWRPVLDDRPLDLIAYDQSLALAIDPDGSAFTLGTVWSIYRFDAKGGRRWRLQAPAAVLGVVPTADGRRIVAALGDGSIRWYAVADGREIAAFLPEADAKAWIAWTPGGFYMAGPGGDRLVGWHVNRGAEQAADFFAVGRFRDLYYRPDIVRDTLADLDEAGAIRRAGRAAPTDLAGLLPPVINLLDPEDGSSVAKPEVAVRYALRTPAAAPATTIRVLTDGRPLGSFPAGSPRRAGELVDTLRVIVPRRDVDLALVAENANAASEPARARLKWEGAPAAADRPKAHALAVGIAEYRDDGLKLELAAKDAHDFVAALRRQQGRAFASVEAEVITDAEATPDRIRGGLARLQSRAAFGDLVLVFFSGHGFDDPSGAYHFMTVGTPKAAPTREALRYDELRAAIAGIAANVVLFIDTCHAGDAFGPPGVAKADVNRVVNDLVSAENGVVVFAASTGDQLSYENKLWGNGAFTKAIVEGLDGAARLGNRPAITTAMLEIYVGERVRDLTADRQTPIVGKPMAVGDLTLARVEN